MSKKLEIIDFELGKIVVTPKTKIDKVDKVLKKRKKKIEDKKAITKEPRMYPEK